MFRSFFRSVFSLIFVSFFASCGTTQKLKRDLKTNHKNSSFFKGFVLYNPETGKEIINHNGAKYFTPASNTKLYTFYAAYKTLGDSIKGLEYIKRNDTLFIKGTGDPSFLYNKFKNANTIPFLNRHVGPIVIIDDAIDDDKFGSGWSWGDYQYSYMPEKSMIPIYSNIVSYKKQGDSVVSIPGYFSNKIEIQDDVAINRSSTENNFYIKKGDTTNNYVPFKTSTNLVVKLLSDTLQKPVSMVSKLESNEFKTMYSVPSDSVYKQMLTVSDNFIAEQLLLQVGKEVSGEYNVHNAIDSVLKNHLSTLPQNPRWVDGSGLSRYNLTTPENTVHLLTKMYREIPLEKLMDYFPVGGKTGTLRSWYANDPPFVYAKTGTLSNNHCLSGYLITKKGTVFIFSFMNNHYRISSSLIKEQMQDHLFKIYNKY